MLPCFSLLQHTLPTTRSRSGIPHGGGCRLLLLLLAGAYTYLPRGKAAWGPLLIRCRSLFADDEGSRNKGESCVGVLRRRRRNRQSLAMMAWFTTTSTHLVRAWAPTQLYGWRPRAPMLQQEARCCDYLPVHAGEGRLAGMESMQWVKRRRLTFCSCY